MTVEEKIRSMLIERGMFDTQAQEVIDATKTDEWMQFMASKWADKIDGYPSQFLAALWINVKRAALRWIDTNLPMAFFRSEFE